MSPPGRSRNRSSWPGHAWDGDGSQKAGDIGFKWYTRTPIGTTEFSDLIAMELTINRTLSVWDGEWVDTAAETLHSAATEFARRRRWRDGTWRAVTDIEELDAYHYPVARRRFRVLRAGARTRRVDAQAGNPVGFVVPPQGEFR